MRGEGIFQKKIAHYADSSSSIHWRKMNYETSFVVILPFEFNEFNEVKYTSFISNNIGTK